MPRDVGLISRLSVETDGPPVTQAIQLAAGLESSRCLVTVRPIDDHYKPTLTMLDDHGRASAYVKLGWTLGTADLVRVEASALQQVAGRLGPDLASPRVLAAGNDPWDRPFCATAPLPGSLRRSSRQLPSPRLMRDLAGPVTRVSADAILSGWDANPASSSRRHLVRAARSMLTRHWRDGVASGRAHGDWVPWNTATRNGRMVAWDWEHFRELAPLGLDALHWTVFSARSLDSCAWADAYAAALDSHDSSSVLPVERADRAALALYHATELLLKSERLRERGGVEPFPVDDIVADLLRRGAGGRSDG